MPRSATEDERKCRNLILEDEHREGLRNGKA
jgi:hypothetical protein